MYFGNLNNVLRFDNTTWKNHPLKGTPIVKSGLNGEVYAAGYNRIIKITPFLNRMQVKELKIPKDNFIGQVSSIHICDEQVFFVAPYKILTLKQDSLIVIFESETELLGFSANNKLVIHQKNAGLFELNTNTYKLKILPFTQILQGLAVIDVFATGDKNMLIKCAGQASFLKYSADGLSLFETDADMYLQENGYVKAIALKNNTIVIGTEYGGIICIDQSGRYLFSLNKKHGMLDNRITDLFVDASGKLWVATYNGISLVDFPSQLCYFNTSYGINGAISSMMRFNNKMYFGSTQGLYYFDQGQKQNLKAFLLNDEKSFVKVPDILAETHDLAPFINSLYVSTDKGLYKLDSDDRVTLIYEGEFRKIHFSQTFPNIVFGIGKGGAAVFEIIDNELQFLGRVSDFDFDVRTIAEDSDSVFWIGSNNDGLFRLDFKDQNLLHPKITQYYEDTGLPKDFMWVDTYKTQKGVIFSTQKGVLHYENGKFVPHYMFKNLVVAGINHFFPIVEQQYGKIWFSSINENTSERITGYLNYNHSEIVNYFYKDLNVLKEVNIESIYCDVNNVVWFGGFDGLVRYAQHTEETGEKLQVLCVIRKTDLPSEKENILFDDEGKQIYTPSLSYSNNHVQFEFTAFFYDSHGEVEYKTRLEGFNDSWSDWSTITFKDYTYLPPGNYRFMVQARDIYGNLSETAIFEFTVLSPLYLRWWAFLIYLLFLSSLIFMFFKLNELKHAADKNKLERVVAERTNELIRQKEQTQKLVQRLLPEKTVEEIQKDGKAQSKKYDLVTVLFADIQGFTKIAENVDAQILVGYLNKIFSAFDTIISKYQIDKIKTIGDAYMCAAGMRIKDRTTPSEMVLAALQMQEALPKINQEFNIDFKIRIGIHTGSVIAGVVGEHKIEYDIWGDTVNIASRMESYGIVGKVNISSSTYEYIKDFFECEERGKTTVKYKGDLDMYLVHRIKKDLSEFSSGKVANSLFSIKMQNLRYNDLEEFMLQKIERDLPKNLYYHNVRHTVNVCSRVEHLGREEKVNEEELLLLKTAALFHDAGFMISYDNNEPLGANLAADILPSYRYTPEQIQRVKDLILSTKMPPKPKNHLEQIMCDADLDYLGRSDFIVVSQNLFRELFERHKVNTIEEWNRFQYRFISKHEYFTQTARNMREEGKKEVLEELKKRI